MGYMYVIGTVIFTVFGQTLIKKHVTPYGKVPDGAHEKALFFIKLLMDPFIISGFFMAFVAALFWMAAMTEMDMSKAYPIVVGGLILVNVCMAVLILGERLDPYKAAGILMIVLGIIVMNKKAILGD